jgi:hypothetical protein
LNTARLSRFSDVTWFGPIGARLVLDRIIDGRVRTVNRDCSCGDKFVITNCIENAILASKFETARKPERERIGRSA